MAEVNWPPEWRGAARDYAPMPRDRVRSLAPASRPDGRWIRYATVDRAENALERRRGGVMLVLEIGLVIVAALLAKKMLTRLDVPGDIDADGYEDHKNW